MRPGLRSTSVKKVKVRLPGGVLTTHFDKAKPSHHECAGCGSQLHGLKRLHPIRYSNLSMSAKTVNRKFGGELCSKCSRERIKNSVKVIG